jgi:GT2 family glycosyltransferase
MFVDADNQVYPTCLARLADALRATSDAAAAYSILEDFGDASELRSALAWDVDRLCRGNYIDAQSMWRRDAWLALGGFDRTLDLTLGGWEDWDLWLRLADRGGRAVLVPEILGRYRVQRGSMVALTNLAHDDGIAAMRSRHDALPWPAA